MSIQAASLPDLQIGKETPWPARRDGKQIYAKLVDFGGFPLPYGTRAVSHDVPDIEWSQISWDHSYIASFTDNSRRRSLALVSTPESSGSAMPWRFLVDRNSIQVNMLTMINYQEWNTIVICLLYTKTSEGAESGQLIQPGPDGAVLTSRGDELVWEDPSGPSLPRLKSVMITASGVFTAPYTGSYTVRLQGGGGAGSGIGSNLTGRYIGCGGNSGQFRESIVQLTKGQEVPYTIGAAGLGTNFTGGDGGSTIFGDLPAALGGYGAFTNPDSLGNYETFGFPYIGSSTLNNGYGSEMGENGFIRTWTSNSKPYNMQSGRGGNSRYGKGGDSGGNSNAINNGVSASGYGAGGGGALRVSGSSPCLGGNGAPGCIEIVMYDV